MLADDSLTAEIASRYGDYLRHQGNFADAEPVLEAAANEVRKAVSVPARDVATSRQRVAEMYQDWKKPAEAAKWRYSKFYRRCR